MYGDDFADLLEDCYDEKCLKLLPDTGELKAFGLFLENPKFIDKMQLASTTGGIEFATSSLVLHQQNIERRYMHGILSKLEKNQLAALQGAFRLFHK